MVPEFNKKELNVLFEVPDYIGGGPSVPIYSYPISPREACRLLLQRKAVWQIFGAGVEESLFTPKVNPDNIARAFVFDGTFLPGVTNTSGGKDMFGIEWEYVPRVGGSMVRPGKPFLEDANDWYDKVLWPDIDGWDWEGSRKENQNYFNENQFHCCMFLNGWYERLISFMDFDGAIVAMIDEDQKPAVKDLFARLSGLYIKILDKYLDYFPQIDLFCIHDDWGSQKETFFSPATAEEMIVPYMRLVTDFLHSKGKYCELHSCGQLLKQVPNIIAAGWDSWTPQAMNDTQKIYDLYGDRLLVGVIPDSLDPNASENVQREAARAYANRFCLPEKPSMWNMYANRMLTPAFREEMYRQSRLNYAQ